MACDIIVGGGNRSMPNIKSQMKRDRKNKEQQVKNKAEKSAMKTAMKKFDAAVTAGDKEAAATTYKVAVSAVDRAAGKNLIHKNNAAHKKSAMDKKMNEMA
jgi:small subunit ribosomal protein S20